METHALASDSRPRLAVRVTQAIELICHSIGTGVKGVRRYGSTISAHYGVSKLKQFLRLSIDHYLNRTSPDEFYRYQFYLPEPWKLRGQHLVYSKALHAQWRLLGRLASPDSELLYKKDKFAAACGERNIPTIPIIAEFLNGQPQGAFAGLPSADLFSKRAFTWCGRGAEAWHYDPVEDLFTGTCAPPEPGVQVAPHDSAGLTKQQVVAALCERSKKEGKIIVQRKVGNHSDMAPLTNGALATIRIVTCRAPTGVIDMLPPVIRMPSGHSVIDNFAGGGMVAPLDRDTGTIIGPAIQKDPAMSVKWLAAHPDTGTPLMGFTVPNWAEVVELALRAHQAFPTLHFVGWDIAVLQGGPILLEGNPSWDPDVVVLPHRITLSDTQFVPYFNYHIAQPAVYSWVGSAAICGVARDGWLTPEAKVLIKDPESGKRLTLTLEVPGWLPFDYPVTLQVTVDGHVKETFEFAQSGTHKIHLPLAEAGTIALRIGKWFVPANLGIGSRDQRPLAYRLTGAALEEISSIAVNTLR